MVTKLEMRRELGLGRGTTKRERNHALSADTCLFCSKFNKWQRSHNSVYLCGSFIFVFFAAIITVSYFLEPSIAAEAPVFHTSPSPFVEHSILVGGDGSRPAFLQNSPTDRIREGSSLAGESQGVSEIMAIRRFLVGSLSTISQRIVEEDAVEHHRPKIEVQDVQRTEQIDHSKDSSLVSGEHEANTLGLATGMKIFVYELPSEFNSDWLVDSRCSNQLFAAEVAIHKILLTSRLRTMAPEEADFFFVPVYVSCNFTSKTGFPSLTNAPAMIREAVDIISREMVYWNRSGGSDHIFVATHDFGACFHALENFAIATGIPEFLRRSVILQTFGRKDGHPCQEVENIQIPPYVSPETVKKYWNHPEKRKRDILAYFRGKLELHPRNVSGLLYGKGIRTRLWHKFKRDKRFFLSRKRRESYQLEMARSVFCLAPLGWAPWSPRIVEAVMYGCVPVIIADNISLPHSHVVDWPSISLTVAEADVDNLRKILLRVVATNLTTIQQNLWDVRNRRALIYTEPLVYGDSTWQIFNLLSKKKLDRRMQSNLTQTGNHGDM